MLRLLYKAAEWHALAKLRLHTDSTLELLKAVTREFCHLMRQFRDKTLDKFNTVELPREAGTQKGGAKKKVLNLNTYKFHALGDYVATIRLFGTTDSYPTQLVCFISGYVIVHIETLLPQGELAHRLVKRLYGLTNKQNTPEQIAHRYRQAHHFGASESRDCPLGGTSDLGDDREPRHDAKNDSPKFHHSVTSSRNNPVELASFSTTHDPAAKVLVPQLPYSLNVLTSYRILSPNFVFTSSANFLGKTLMVTTHPYLRTMNKTLFGS